MHMYYFDVTMKVMHRDAPEKVVLYKAARARNELAARRLLLNQFFNRRFQVVRIDRVGERCFEAGGK